MLSYHHKQYNSQYVHILISQYATYLVESYNYKLNTNRKDIQHIYKVKTST